MRVYLAGKMGGRMGRDVLDERKRAVDACIQAGITPVDPARNENIDPDKLVDLRMDYVTMKNFVAKDEHAISHCDGLLVLTGDTPSEGTGLEFGLMISLHRPVVLVSPKRCAGDLMGFWNIKSNAMFTNVEDAAKFMADNYMEDLNAIH